MRTIHLLLVEDEPVQQRLVAHHLGSVEGCHFEICHAISQEAATQMFDDEGIELVILDFQLKQGNGLDCLIELRLRDPLVPIIAVSGMATEEVAAALLQAGADDYIRKDAMNGEILRRSVLGALSRTDAWRRHRLWGQS
jgi:DNA-binding response OmpR family regulator